MLGFFTSDLRRNIIKIFCLTIGMAFGFLLVAKVYFEVTYDTFFPDSQNLYRITETVVQDGKYDEWGMIPGAVAPGMKEYIPQVVASTRATRVMGDTYVKTRDGRGFHVDGVILADSCHFDVLPREIVQGKPHDALAVENTCMIPKSLADLIGGDVMDIELSLPAYSADYWIRVGGVYDDYPANSTISNALYLSLSSIRHFTGDGRDNWVGNDRYIGHLRLTDGTTRKDIQPYIDRMVKDNVDPEAIEIVNLSFSIKPIISVHADDRDLRAMTWILALLATIMLMSASLNYLLIVIGQMVMRAKEMAVRKCFGTGNLAIFCRIMSESLGFILVAAVLAILIVFCFSDECRRILGYSPEVLFTTSGVWIVEGGVCLVLLVIAGVIPAWMYVRTPVARAFRPSPSGSKVWKLVMLSIQFFASGLLFCLLVLIARQYLFMTGVDLGFNPENVAIVNLDGFPRDVRKKLVDELRKQANIQTVGSADQDFVFGSSGNNVWIEGYYDKYFNVADMYYADKHIADVLEMKFVEGEMFDQSSDSLISQVIVEERFIEAFKKNFNVDGKLIGRRFNISEHGEAQIVGIISDMRRGGFAGGADTRPGVIFAAKRDDIRRNLYVRFYELTPENLEEIQTLLTTLAPDYEPAIYPYRLHVDNLFDPVLRFGTSVTIAGVAIMLIAMIGLMGYTADEVERRAREIAIRKINGTSVAGILRLFCTDILRVAVPSLVLGGAVAVIIGRDWLSHFADRVSISPLAMIVTLIILTLILMLVVIFNSLKIARSNPVDYLRTE